MATDKLISELTLATPEETDVIPFVDISDTTMGLGGTTKKATKADLKGEKGDKGDTGATGATGAQGIQGIQGIQGVKGDTGAKGDKGDTGDTGNGISSIIKTGTVGLTDTYTITFTDSTTTTYDVVNGEDGTNGTNGTNGTDGDDAYVYIAYASADDGTDFTLTFNSALDYIAIKTTTTPIAIPVASDFTGLWKNYKGATGSQGIQGIQGVAGTDGDDGNGIVSITKTGTVGLVDTYRITFTDTTTFDYDVTNGQDGTGSGDVMGPAGAVADNIAVFDSTTGKLIKDGGKKISELQLALGFTPENVSNKSTTLDTDKTSDTKYPSVKSVYDWAIGLFQTLANKVTSFQVTPDDTHYPSEKLVKDSLDAKAPLASPTFTGTVTLPKTLEIQDTSADHQYVLSVNELTADRTVTLPLLTGNDEFVFKDHTQTLTNKRNTARVTAITSHATPTINTDNCDAVDITALAEDITNMSTNLSGTPTNKQKLLFEIKDNGTARAISWGTSFVAGGVALPTTTVLSKILTVGFIYSTANSLNKWRCIAVAQEA